MSGKAWLLVAGVLSALGMQLGTTTHGWQEVLTPGFVAGVFINIATVIVARYQEPPDGGGGDSMKKTLGVLLAFVVGSALMIGCASAPPNLNPAATAAWHQHEVQKDLDLLRDIAVDAEAQHVLSTATTRAVVNYHRSAIILVHDAHAGWPKEVSNGLTALKDNLPPAEYQKIGYYVDLVRSILKGVQ